MAKSNLLNFTQNLKMGFAQVLAADAALTLKTVYTGGSNDSVVKGLEAISDDTSARVLNLYINNTVSDFLIGSVNIPASSGTNGTTAAVDLLSGILFPGLPYDAQGKRILSLPADHVLKVSCTTTLTATKIINVKAYVEDF